MAWDPINTRTLSPADDVQGRGSSDFFVRQAYGGQRRQEKVSNTHHVIEDQECLYLSECEDPGRGGAGKQQKPLDRYRRLNNRV